MLALLGCAPALDPQSGREGGSDTVFAEEAAEAARAGTRTLIDVRLGNERLVPTATPLASAQIPFDPKSDPAEFAHRVAAALGGDRSQPVTLLCLVGVRSGWAAETLLDAGFTDVASVHDGYRDWPKLDR